MEEEEIIDLMTWSRVKKVIDGKEHPAPSSKMTMAEYIKYNPAYWYARREEVIIVYQNYLNTKEK